MATLGAGYAFAATEQITNAKLHTLVNSGTCTGILNVDVDAGADIVDTKLHQITTAEKVSITALTDMVFWEDEWISWENDLVYSN